ncbi:hypothetical protein D3C78_801530 [compost metagenome]
MGVVIDELAAGQHARRVAWLAAHHLHRCRIIGFDPVGEGVAQVHQRIAQGGQFPVEHADDLHRVVRVEDDVVEAVVVMHDAGGRVVGRHLVVEPGFHRLPLWRIGGQGLLVAIAPAFDLARHVAFGLAEVTQAVGVVVDLVQFDEFVDEALAQGLGFRRVQPQLRRQVGAQDDAVDPFHHVELGTDHRFVGAVHVGFRAVRKAVAQLIEDAEFTAHVVGRLGPVAEGRTTQDEFLFGVFQQVGEV